MEPDLSAKLARSQASLQHIITVILERMVAVFYILYSGRPGYVTCCGIIGSAMFYIGGYLLAFPPPNILSDINDNNDINIYYLASNILPFETFVHIALLFLASITYWKVQNILSFCMVKCGCFYLFIHSIFSLILLSKYFYTYYESTNYAMITVPLTFICWFLIASFFGFVIVSKQHASNQELKYKWKQIKNTKHQNKNYQQLSSDDVDHQNENENEAESQHQCDQQFINRQYWSYYIYVLLGLNVLWYISYSLAQCINNLYSMRQCGPDSILTVGAWIAGYTQSFTQCFHHAFILSCIYNIVFRPWCHNTVYIAIGATLTSFLLHAGYLLLFLSEMEWKFEFEAGHIATFHSLSLGLILSKTGILSLLLVCERKLYHLLSPKKEYNKHELVRKRPTMLDILSFDGMTRRQMKALYAITMSSTFFFVSMHLEIIFMLCASTFLFREEQNPWLIFNEMLLWSFHLCTVYVHAMVVSVQFSDSFVRASRLLASLNASLLIFAVCNIGYVSYAIYRSPTAKYVYLDYIVIVFCLLRCLASFGGWIGFSKLKTIQPFSMPVYKYDEITENDKKRTKLPVRYVWGYAALLLLYFVACLYRLEWNGNLFGLHGCNWPIICSDTPLYGLLFHSGLLNMIFIFDAGISKRWAPTWDLSRLFLASIAILGAVQIVNCLLLYCGDIYAYNKCEIALLLSLLVWMAFSLKMSTKLHALDNLFLYKRKIFI